MPIYSTLSFIKVRKKFYYINRLCVNDSRLCVNDSILYSTTKSFYCKPFRGFRSDFACDTSFSSRQRAAKKERCHLSCNALYTFSTSQLFQQSVYLPKYSATFFIFSIIGRFCGQIFSHLPHAIQSLAFPKVSVSLS